MVIASCATRKQAVSISGDTPWATGIDLELERESGALSRPIQVGAQCGRQAKVVEHGGTQVERQLSDLVNGIFDGRHCVVRRRREIVARLLKGLQTDLGDRQSLADFVVELARDSAAFVLLNFNHARERICDR